MNSYCLQLQPEVSFYEIWKMKSNTAGDIQVAKGHIPKNFTILLNHTVLPLLMPHDQVSKEQKD